MFFRDYYFSSGNSRVNRLIALFRCIVVLMKQISELVFWEKLEKNVSCLSSAELAE